MNISVSRVKIIVTIPVQNVEEVRKTICETGAGIIGNYTYCSTSSKCLGTFKPEEPVIDIVPLLDEESFN